MKFIDGKIYEYCLKYSHKDTEILKVLTKYTYSNEELPQMISGNMVGNFLQLLIKSSQSKKILEIGTFTGYSAIKMAENNSATDTFDQPDPSPGCRSLATSSSSAKTLLFSYLSATEFSESTTT